jgi:flagellar basal-body rod protein FlgB
MSWVETPLLQRMERYLDLASLRQSLISSNIANVDTPGYRTRDVDFEKEMQRAAAATPDTDQRPVVRDVRGLIERPDGNNVSIDRETMLLAQTQLQFQAGVALLKQEFKRLQTAITEGKS